MHTFLLTASKYCRSFGIYNSATQTVRNYTKKLPIFRYKGFMPRNIDNDWCLLTTAIKTTSILYSNVRNCPIPVFRSVFYQVEISCSQITKNKEGTNSVYTTLIFTMERNTTLFRQDLLYQCFQGGVLAPRCGHWRYA